MIKRALLIAIALVFALFAGPTLASAEYKEPLAFGQITNIPTVKPDGADLEFNEWSIIAVSSYDYTVDVTKTTPEVSAATVNDDNSLSIQVPWTSVIYPRSIWNARVSFDLQDGDAADDAAVASFTVRVNDAPVLADVVAKAEAEGSEITLAYLRDHLSDPVGSWIPSGISIGDALSAEGRTLPGADEVTREGFTFGGWYDNSACEGDPVTGNYKPTTATTLYAKWIPVDEPQVPTQYTVTFKAKDAHPAKQIAKTDDGEGTVVLPSKPHRSGYKFVGWNTKHNGSGDEFTSATVVTGNITVYAQWTANPTPNAPTVFEGVTACDKSIEGISDPCAFITISVNGYWVGNTIADSEGNWSFSGFTLILRAGDVIVATAKKAGQKSDVSNVVEVGPRIKLYKVKLDPTGGKVRPNRVRQTVEGEEITLPTPWRKGYTFEGWYTKPDGAGCLVPTTMAPKKNVTLYAYWIEKPKIYTVTFIGNGGKPVSQKAKTAPGGGTVELPQEPTRKHYAFAGWTINQDGTGGYFEDNTMVDSNMKVYAQWALIPPTVEEPVYAGATTITGTSEYPKARITVMFFGADGETEKYEGSVKTDKHGNWTLEYEGETPLAEGDTIIAVVKVKHETSDESNVVTVQANEDQGGDEDTTPTPTPKPVTPEKLPEPVKGLAKTADTTAVPAISGLALLVAASAVLMIARRRREQA